jgi:hypothetical protein
LSFSAMAGSLKERIGKDGKSVSPVGSFMVRSLASYDQITTRIIFAEDAKTEGSFMVGSLQRREPSPTPLTGTNIYY